MAGDYDLVVIGGGEAGWEAATAAARLQARVALVFQGMTIDPGFLTRQVLLQASRSLHPFSLKSDGLAHLDRAALVSQLQQWADVAASRMAELYAPAVLASLGVEVIEGSGAFHRKPTLGFEVNGRSLRSQRYFLAAGSRPVFPKVDGLQTVGSLEVDTIAPTHLRHLNSLVVMGSGPSSAEVAQALARLGWQVVLATGDDRLLPQVDPEAVQLIQSHLEAEGVRVLSHAPVTQVRSIHGKKWVQVGNQAIETDEILLETQRQPDLESLNLEAAQVRWSAAGIALNNQLQTTNPNIYACPFDGWISPPIGQQQAHRAIENALFPRRSRPIADPVRLVHTQPELATIGLTEPQAQEQDAQVLRQFFKALPQAQIGGNTGFCKLILRRNGTLIGAHIVGGNARDLISPIVLAMQQNLKIQSLADLAAPGIVSQTAREWKYLRSHQSFWQKLFHLWRD